MDQAKISRTTPSVPGCDVGSARTLRDGHIWIIERDEGLCGLEDSRGSAIVSSFPFFLIFGFLMLILFWEESGSRLSFFF
jgi:hypothetical protein